MPGEWEPPAPAWMSDLTRLGRAAVGYFGLQSRHGPDAATLRRIADLLRSTAPRVEFARYVDGEGFSNAVVVAYWRSADDCCAWAEDGSTQSAWDEVATSAGEQGLWREIMEVPPERLETLFSADDDPAGFAHLGDGWFGPIEEHGYWGGMRDRIPLSGSDPLEASRNAGAATREAEWVAVPAPHNLCVIRSGQNPTQCVDRELELYRTRVYPRLTEGMDYLRDSGRDIGCVSCRFFEETDSDGAGNGRTFGHAYFGSMGQLEAWAESHPTHEAIFGEFLKFAEEFGADMQLRLWHEVFVLDAADRHRFEYRNCHPRTGLLSLIA